MCGIHYLKDVKWNSNLPGKGKVHEAEQGHCQERDSVRFVEELDTDVVHLLLVYHSEV